jgi:hypothetical protein
MHGAQTQTLLTATTASSNTTSLRATLQRGAGVVERPQQPRDLLPPSGGGVVAGQAAQIVHAEFD